MDSLLNTTESLPVIPFWLPNSGTDLVLVSQWTAVGTTLWYKRPWKASVPISAEVPGCESASGGRMASSCFCKMPQSTSPTEWAQHESSPGPSFPKIFRP